MHITLYLEINYYTHKSLNINLKIKKIMKTNVQLKSNLTIKKLFTVLSIGAFSMMFSQGTSVEKPIKIGDGNPQVLKSEVKKIKKAEKVTPYTLVPMLSTMEKPMYKEGDEAFRNAVITNLDRQHISGTGLQYTTVSFLVDEKGKIYDVKAEGNNETLNLASIIAVYKVKDGFSPATLGITKMAARVRYTIPVEL